MNTRLPALRNHRRLVAIASSFGLALSVSLSGASGLTAAPREQVGFEILAQNVDYISVEMSPALNLGFPVLVPGWVPSPFGGPPAIDAGGGYYGLYWMNVGGEPTFLHVTGQVGGSLPVGSPYDLNNELFINASVMGYDAIHDVTPAYDAVWWIAGGVLYKVESRNSGTDSLSLANSLIAFAGPAAPEPEPTVAPEPTSPPEPTLAPEPTVAPQPTSPSDPAPTSPPDVVVPGDDPQTESPADSEATTEPTGEVGEAESDSGAGGTGNPLDATTDLDEEGDSVDDSVDLSDNTLTSDGTGQSTVSSDGTGGPDVPAIDGDGTGGAGDIYVPRRSSGVQVP